MNAKKNLSPADLIMLLASFLLLGCMVFMLQNQVRELGAARSELAKQQAAVAVDEERLGKLIVLKGKYSELQAQWAETEHMLPDNPDEDVLINELKSVANRSGMRLVQVKFEERASKQGYVEQPLKLTFEGRYHGMLQMLDDLRSCRRVVRVNEVKIAKGQQDSPIIQIDLSACAFSK
ncbi:MAG: type 4a pilus biogenesis protein PilO [Desulfotomaculaceae bacterium]|nr:type 4a pilus biogenesis protein PilO [Desulfotomaculaceae bacterium]